MDRFEVVKGDLLAMTPQGYGGYYNAAGSSVAAIDEVITELTGDIKELDGNISNATTSYNTATATYTVWLRRSTQCQAPGYDKKTCGDGWSRSHTFAQETIWKNEVSRALQYLNGLKAERKVLATALQNAIDSKESAIAADILAQDAALTPQERQELDAQREEAAARAEAIRIRAQADADAIKASTAANLQRDLASSAEAKQKRMLYFGYTLVAIVVIGGMVYGVRKLKN